MSTGVRLRKNCWHQWLVAWFLLACMLGMTAPAKADPLNDFLSVYKQIEQAAPAGALPVKSSDFEASKGLFNCLSDQNEEPAQCLADFNDTPLGKQASQKGGIPEAFWQVLDAYIAYIEKDYWGVAYNLGEAAVCAVVQVLLGGVDACSLIKELVELAKDLYDAAKAVVDFLEDVGGAAKDVASCLVTLGSDCGDDSPPVPDETYVYEYVFLPRIAEGVTKRELVDGSYPAFVTTLENNAKHKPTPILSKSWPFGEKGPTGAETFLYPHFTAKAISNARALYEKAVDTNWSKHVLEKVLPQLGTERSQYLLGQTVAVAKQAAQEYAAKKFPGPDVLVKSMCYDHFTKARPYRHVDDWIQYHPGEAAKYKAKSNPDWCEQEFWGQKQEFAKYFREYVVETKLCPEFGGSLVCQDLSKYETCTGIMGSVFQQAQCGLNVQYVGKDVAQEIVKYFKSKGSKYADSCEIPSMLSSPQSKTPATLRCRRPTLQYHCDKYYQENYGTGPKKIPFKALQCELGQKLPGDYEAKESKTWGSMIPALVQKHPDLQIYVANKGPDPLMIVVPPKVYAALASDATALGFGVKTILDNEPSIDGMENPTLAGNLGGMLKDTMNTVPVNTMGPKFGGVNPPDPAGKLSPQNLGNMKVMDSAKTVPVVVPQNLGQSTPMSGKLPGNRPEGPAGRTNDSVPLSSTTPDIGKGDTGAPALTAVKPEVAAAAAQLPAPIKPRSGNLPDATSAVQPASPRLQAVAPVPAPPVILPVPRPKLAVVSVVPQVQNNCQSPSPAFIAQVNLKNNGAPLPAGKGTVFVKETGGANLGSAGIQLPSLGSNEMKQVAVPAATLAPYSALAGKHQVLVVLNPLIEGGKESFDKPAAPFRFSVTFPAGFCQPQQRLAPAAPQSQVLPQQSSPPLPSRSIPTR